MSDRVGRCHDCTAPQTEVNMLSRHILELQADKGRLIDKVSELEAQIEKMKCCYNCQKNCGSIDRRICEDNNFKDWQLRR